MGLDKQGFEETAIRFDLALQLFIDLRTHARLLFVRHDVVDIRLGPVCAQDGTIEPTLLKIDNIVALRNDLRVVDPGLSDADAVPMIELM